MAKPVWRKKTRMVPTATEDSDHPITAGRRIMKNAEKRFDSQKKQRRHLTDEPKSVELLGQGIVEGC